MRQERSARPDAPWRELLARTAAWRVVLVVASCCAACTVRAPGADSAPTGRSTGTRRSTASAASQPRRSARQVADDFVGHLVARRYDAAARLLDPRALAGRDAAQVRAGWERLTVRAGAYREITRVRQEGSAGHRVLTYTCRFSQASVEIELIIGPTGLLGRLLYRPLLAAVARGLPPYAAPERYVEREVHLGRAPWLLPGTLSLPRTAAGATRAPPALLLVHGSGPHDRDETIGPNKPFRDLAVGLASRGIAVLRYDKRTYVHRRAVLAAVERMTSKEQTIDDALSGLALLRRTPGVDARRIFVLGHSLGGHLLPRIATAERRLAGLIFLAAHARPFEQSLKQQFRFLATLDGKINEHEARRLKTLDEKIARLAKLAPGTPRKLLPLGLSAAFWLDLRAHPPLPLLRALRQPMLFLQGDRDYQVPGEDLAAWRRALRGRRNVRFVRYPRANHILHDGEGKPHPREYKQAGYVTKQAIEDIAAFVHATQ